MTLYYTYSHAKPDGSIFYIGKGANNRAYSFSARNRYWKRIVAKYGNPTVQILAHWKTEQEAFDHEMLLIDCFKDMGYKLANITKGGDGVAGLKWADESKLKLSKSKMGVKFIGRGATSVQKGDKLPEHHANKLREHLKIARAKIDHSKIYLPKATCLVCKKTGTQNGMARWHFDKCKEIQ